MISLGLSLVNNKTAAASSSPTYDTDAQAYFAAMSVTPDDTQKGYLNTLILNIKAVGATVWSRLDLAYVIAAHDAQAARLNMKNPAGTAMTASNSPTFTAFRGYAGNAVNAALNLGINNNALVNATQNATAWGLGVQDHATSAQFLFGLTGAGTVNTIASNASASRQWRCNSSASVTTAQGALIGRYMAVRDNSANFNAYFNGTLISNLVSASTVVPGIEFSLLRTGTNYSNARLSFFWIGNLTDAEAIGVDTAFSTYLTSIGA